MIKISLPDGTIKEYANAITGMDIAKDISEGLARNVLSIQVNDEVWDLTRPITSDAKIKLYTWDDPEGKATFWHTSAHIMAEAIEQLYPGTKFGIGPDIENGFYYDMDFGEKSITEADLEVIEKKMLELARQNQPLVRKSISKDGAIDFFTKKNDNYKLELISELADGTISLYESGHFTDLCRGPHLSDTSKIKAVKLLSIAGAYWRGDEKRPMMTRIYGITFPKQKELDEYLVRLEEAKKRDHRKIGRELEIFMFSQRVGSGLPIWLPKGAALRERLEQFLKNKQREYGYSQVITPHIGNVELYKTSGHFQKYGKDSFQPIQTPIEGEEFMLKPMNCPHHCEIYAQKPRSYKDLPIRLAEFGTVYRYEQSGELHGLTRARSFTQDDAHIFCRPDQLKEEFIGVIEIVLYIFKTLGFNEYTAQVSLRDPNNKEKYIGSDENWDKAERAILEATKEKGMETIVVEGEAAFYGPKLDFMVRDAIGRKWQLGTIQVDYNLPDRFDLEYIGSDNQRYRPVMIHRAPFGSMERFVAVLLEHSAGKLPLWLTPDQAIVLPISEKYESYANKVVELLEKQDIRCLIDNRAEKVNKKIREAELKRIPYMLIVGEKEEKDETVSIRRQGEGDLGAKTIAEFAELIKNEIKKTLTNIGGKAIEPNRQDTQARRKPQKEEPYRVNQHIKAPMVRIVGDDIESSIISLREAIAIAEEQGLDLVEISPNANPPVCKVIDYRKFLYERKKKAKEQKAKSTKITIKELRLSPNTDEHDFNFKLKHAISFLKEGSKVKVDVFFKGRSIVYKEQGEIILLRFADALSEYGKVESLPKLEGKRMIMIVAPKK